MKSFWLILFIIICFFISAFSGFLLSNFLNQLELANTSSWVTINKNDDAPTPSPPDDFNLLIKNPRVTCTGCDYNPRVTTSDAQKNTIPNNTATVGRIVVRYNYIPANYSILSDKSTSASEIVYDILRRQDLGHLTSSLNIPNVSYITTMSTFNNGSFFVPQKGIRLAKNVTLSTNFSIRVPTITDAQFASLKNTHDYRYVYGLIRGIVGHEELHFDALKNYLNEIAFILNAPLEEDVVISAGTALEMNSKLNNLLTETVKKRLATARIRHETAQNAIDSGDIHQKISFHFQDKINGEIPARIVGEFRGKGTFDFTLPPGPIPKPPTPNISVK